MTDPKTLDYQHIAVAEFMLKANQTVPILPIVPHLSVRRLRARLILEEALETIEALGLELRQIVEEPFASGDLVTIDSFDIKVGYKKPSLKGIADGCADLKVVTVGTEIACGINGMPIFEEVMRSNFTKFSKGCRIREDGKILKGDGFQSPNIEPILRAQGMR